MGAENRRTSLSPAAALCHLIFQSGQFHLKTNFIRTKEAAWKGKSVSKGSSDSGKAAQLGRKRVGCSQRAEILEKHNYGVYPGMFLHG